MRVYENLKSIILTLLIGISLILTGSLWFDNYYGLSSVMSDMISFFNTKIDLEDSRYIKEYVAPYKTTIANGDNGKWIYYISSEANTNSFEFIKDLLINLTDFSVDSAYNSEWEELINRKSIICEFADKIDMKVLNLALNNKLEFSNATSIKVSALAITKTTTGGRLYIKSDDLIYRITINDDIPKLDQIIAQYSDFKTYAKYVALEEIGVDNFNGRKIKTQYDALFPISAKSSNRQNVSKLVVNSLLDNNTEKIEEKVAKIFNNNEYIKFITNENGYIYINDDESVIKIFDNDLVEYASENTVESVDDVTWISSFNIALRFINDASELKNLYLVSAINDNQDYEFVFGTYVDEIPVVDSNKTIANSEKAKIYIKVRNNSVISYKERLQTYLGDIQAIYLSKYAHNIFDDVLTNVPKNSTIEIENVELVYDLATKSNLPVWNTQYKYKDKSHLISTTAAKLRNY